MDDPNNPTIPAPDQNGSAIPNVVPPMVDMSIPGPVTETTTTSSPVSLTTSTTTTMPVVPSSPEPEWPERKPKSKLPQILGGIAAIILLVGVATAAYFVSSRVSRQAAVAPTAPVSEPLAASQSCSENPEAEQCPGDDGVLHSCHPDDGRGYTSDSVCNSAGRVAVCGGTNYCCPVAGGSWTTDMGRCSTTVVTGRQDYCVSASANKAEVKPGETLTLSSVSNTAVNSFFWVVSNLDNLYGPGNPKPVCVVSGSDTTYQGDCPSGTHTLAFSDPNTSLRTTGARNIQFQNLFLTDARVGKQATNLQFNAYFMLNGGEVSLVNPNCVTYTKMGVATTASRPDYCVSATTDRILVKPGEVLTLTSISNASVNKFSFGAYNLENPFPGGGSFKAVCVGNDAVLASCSTLDAYGNPNCTCPQGGHHLIFGDTNTTTLRTNGTAYIPYANLVVNDNSWGGKQVQFFSFNAYFQLNDGLISWPKDACITGTEVEAACVASGTKTCNPDCPTACGTAASTITTCTDSCGVATTKACAATADCACIPSGVKTCSPDCPTACGKAASTITTCVDSCYEDTTKTCAATAACPVVGACMKVDLYAKVGGVYSTTPMTATQSASLHIGDMIRIAITGSKADLKARFRVFVNDVVEPTGNTASPEWIDSNGAYSGADHLTTFYSDFKITQSGIYRFEGQVSSKP